MGSQSLLVRFRKTSLRLILAGVSAMISSNARADVPCDSTQAVEPSGGAPVEIGVRSEIHAGACTYIYTVLNRSRDTLTAVQVGYDTRREACELTGARPHVPPDTAYSPRGWDCVPLQTKDPMTFTLGWRAADSLGNGGGILPYTWMSGFAVVLSQPDTLYERCHWLVRFKSIPRMAYIGRVRPEVELDLASASRQAVAVLGAVPQSIDLGAISGTVTDNRRKPIRYVTVVVEGAQKAAFTAPDGTYKISDLPTGRYTVRARCMGYAPKCAADVLIEGRKVTVVDFKLTDKPIALDRIRAVGGQKQKALDRIPPPRGDGAEDSPASAVHDFIGKMYVHGVPYEQAHKLGRGALPVLREIMADSLEAEHWATACATIGSIGEPEGFPILHDFIWQRFKGKVDETTVRALASAQQCIGLLASDSPAAIAYLSQGVDPDFWAALPWSSPRHTQEKLDLLFARLSISGLGYVDNVSARTELARIREQEVRPILRRAAEAALAASDSVRARGLPGYMRRLRERLGSE